MAFAPINSSSVFVSTPVSAITQTSPNLSTEDTFSVKETLIVDGVEYDLYATFDDTSAALTNIKTNASTILDLLSKTFDLPELSNESWELYYEAVFAMFNQSDCPDWYTETNEEFCALCSFFDIYENTAKNEEIKSRTTAQATSLTTYAVTDITSLLPHNSIRLNDSESISPCATLSNFSISAGTAYAERYAVNENSAYYGYFSGRDCTNFASQILHAGGVPHDTSTSASSGWWFSFTTYSNGDVSRLYSYTWTVADKFAKYMGIDYSTTSHTAFTSLVKAGDFITFDRESDGDWDHFGYVTETSTASSTKIYKVAQHSSDYLAWSNAGASGWTTIGTNGGKYGIVRCN